ncbi:hypothetical protein [Riemerella anatipestifer]|nr:hypothetical protein [Riemerella anatipestifer]MCW0478713.1 hypothetical protein [Riemerella anatipestifer]MCW0499164.1 hypothetical protein [Riemerella anatipestifer]MDR7834117.1 hypothetical protein [Riemerella anatipestifer]MDY3503082.1 hypothetical protein [Riemerella anatipestifer]MDY3505014.1 hypothetical protein [Riemerella anatipestifer]
MMLFLLVACKEKKSNSKPLPKEDKTIVNQKTKEVKSLANLLIHEVVNRLPESDTLYIAVEKQYSICGNDDRFNGTMAPNTEAKEISINSTEAYEPLYKVKNTTVVTGGLLDADYFNADSMEFSFNLSVEKKPVYLLDFISIKNDKVEVVIKHNDKEKSRVVTIFKNNQWEILD